MSMSSLTNENPPNESALDARQYSPTKPAQGSQYLRGESPCSGGEVELDVDQAVELAELERYGLLTEISRRRFIQASSAMAASFALGVPELAAQEASHAVPITLKVNGKLHTL